MARAVFMRKDNKVSASEFVVEKIVELPQKEYEFFTTNLMNDYSFIKENKELMYLKQNIWHCLLVVGEDGNEGVLVECEGADYARYSAFVPDVSVFMHKQYNTLNDMNNRLRETVASIVQGGIQIGCSGEYTMSHEEIMGVFSMHESMLGIIGQMLEERDEVAKVILTDKGFSISYNPEYCSPEILIGEMR